MRRDAAGAPVRSVTTRQAYPTPPPAWAANASATTSGVTSAMPSTVRDGERERVRSGREGAHRHRHDRHPGGVRRADPVARVLDRDAPRGVGAEPPRDLEVDVGRGLAARHLLARQPDADHVVEPRALEHERDDRRVRGRREPERPVLAEPPDRLDRARQQRQLAAVAGEQPLDDGVGDRVGRHVDAELVAHVDRPLLRAHPEHRVRRLVGPRPAAVGDELAARLVPALLGVDEHAVEVEHDGVGPGRGHSVHERAQLAHREGQAGEVGALAREGPREAGEARDALRVGLEEVVDRLVGRARPARRAARARRRAARAARMSSRTACSAQRCIRVPTGSALDLALEPRRAAAPGRAGRTRARPPRPCAR